MKLSLCWLSLCILQIQALQSRHRTCLSTTATARWVPKRIRTAATTKATCLYAVQDDVMLALEQQVVASAQARMDAKRVLQVLDETDTQPVTVPTTTAATRYTIALAAALVTGVASLTLDHNLIVSGIIFVVVFILACADPLQDDSISGAMARMVGRVTLQSVQASQPKLKALARAVVTGEEEILVLKQQVHDLTNQVKELRQWQMRRLFVDQELGNYSHVELKDQARSHGLAVGGTKTQLLMRLVEANVIAVNDQS